MKRSLFDRILGGVGATMVLAAVYLFIAHFVTPARQPSAPPVVEMISPDSGDVVTRPLEVRFRVDSPISVMPGGWGVQGYHIHAEIGGREVMAGAADIRRLPDGAYSWTIAGVPEGVSTLRLFWATVEHRAVPEEVVGPLPITIR